MEDFDDDEPLPRGSPRGSMASNSFQNINDEDVAMQQDVISMDSSCTAPWLAAKVDEMQLEDEKETTQDWPPPAEEEGKYLYKDDEEMEFEQPEEEYQ